MCSARRSSSSWCSRSASRGSRARNDASPTSSDGQRLMGTAVELHGVGKRYVLGATASAGTLRETISDGVRKALRRAPRGPASEIWSLRDVTFDVEEGTRV